MSGWLPKRSRSVVNSSQFLCRAQELRMVNQYLPKLKINIRKSSIINQHSAFIHPASLYGALNAVG
jgi:hypothetical protein